jgi:hypothetical protein
MSKNYNSILALREKNSEDFLRISPILKILYPASEIRALKTKYEKLLLKYSKKDEVIPILIELKINSKTCLYALKKYGFTQEDISDLEKLLFI